MSVLNRSTCEELLALAVQSSAADEVFAVLRSTEGDVFRVADSTADAPHAASEATMQITIRKGKRYGSVQTNLLTPEGLRAAVNQAVAQSAIMPEVPKVVPFPAAVAFEELSSTEQSSSAFGHDSALMKRIIDRTQSASMRISGSLSASRSALAIASSNGLFLHHTALLMHAQFRVYAEDGWSTGYQEQFGETITERDVLTGIDIAIEKCNAWRNPIETKPGRQTTVFEPRALADMLKPLLGQFSSRAIEDGQSFLRKLDGSSFAGSKLFHESISLRSDPRAPECASLPFTMDGTPVRATSWVRAGVIEQVVLDRYEAAENGSEAVPPPTNLLMEGGESTMEDLIRGTEKGLLVTGFASLSIIDPANCLLTGSTRDGLFMIEDGKITRGVRNTLLRETPVYLLKEVEALGRTERTSTTGSYFPMELPSMRVKDVLFGASSGVV